MYFKNKKISFLNFLFLYIILITIISSISYSFFISIFTKLEEEKNTKEVAFLLHQMSQNKIFKGNAFVGITYTKNNINEDFLEEYKSIFDEVSLYIDDNRLKAEIEKNKNYKIYNVSVDSFIQNNLYINTIDFYDKKNRYIFSIKTTNRLKILEDGKETLFLYILTIAGLLLIIFIVISRKQKNLFQNNQKLEIEVNERTAKLNKYITIVNKYVTTSSTDLEGKITHVSEAFCRISGYTKAELIGETHNIVKHEDMDPAIYVNLWDTITEDKKWIGEIKNKKKNGEEYWVVANIEPIYASDGTKIGYTSIRQEITDKKRVEKLSVTDKLTQLYNRVKIEEIFTIEIAKFKRYNTKFSVLLIDVDFFKEVNDTHGHNIGDVFLQEISKLFKSSIRLEDTLGRWGGEEFIILSNNYSLEGVLGLAEKIRKSVENHSFKNIGHKTVSIGVAVLNKDDTQESVIFRADKSLYHAKKMGRNRVCLH